ncbi:hypothetical protein QOZ80_2AG0146490 [Eleusine coracana subsp. coracana]|nr:hypothetical protein QOZ80_2AG0146490 [Eleusine coracana subsp. coracana]
MKRKRGMISTSSPQRDGSLSEPPRLDTIGNNNAAAEKSSDSSGSSPIRYPKSLLVEKKTASGDVVYHQNSDEEVVAAYHRDYHKYQKRLARLQELPTLKPCKYGPNITHWHDLNQKEAVLDVAASVVTLSSYDGDMKINGCTGIIIEWIEANTSAIVVTSSQIICTKTSLDDWEDNNVYALNAKVIAHLADGTTSEMSLLYFSKHYGIACFKITSESGLEVVSLDPKLEFGREVCVLARDTEFGLICRRTTVKALDPCGHQKNHWLFIGAQIPMCCSGGALASFDRNVVGMVLSALPNAAFIPSSIILNCLRLWKRFGHLARPHLGLKLKNVNFMDISYLEHLSHRFNIKSGLIVTKMSAESPAEKNGIRLGDVILNCQGVVVSTISQFEGILLDVFESQFEISGNSNSKVDIELIVYNLRKNASRSITLSAKLSDSMEVFT